MRVTEGVLFFFSSPIADCPGGGAWGHPLLTVFDHKWAPRSCCAPGMIGLEDESRVARWVPPCQSVPAPRGGGGGGAGIGRPNPVPGPRAAPAFLQTPKMAPIELAPAKGAPYLCATGRCGPGHLLNESVSWLILRNPKAAARGAGGSQPADDGQAPVVGSQYTPGDSRLPPINRRPSITRQLSILFDAL